MSLPPLRQSYTQWPLFTPILHPMTLFSPVYTQWLPFSTFVSIASCAFWEICKYLCQYRYILVIVSKSRSKCSVSAGVALNLIWVWLCKLTTAESGILLNWISEQNVAFWTEFWPNFRLPKWIFPWFLGLWVHNFWKCLIWGWKWGLKRTKTWWKGGLANFQEGVKGGLRGHTYLYPIFR